MWSFTDSVNIILHTKPVYVKHLKNKINEK